MSDYLVVGEDRAGIELDEFLCLHYPMVNKGFLRRQVNHGLVLVDGQRSLPGRKLRRDQVVIVDFDADEAPAAPVGGGHRIPVLYEDERMMLVDKPAGLAVEPERWRRDAACVSGALLEMALEEGGQGDAPLDLRPRLVHRLDKDTSGLLCVARTLEAERELRTAFAEGTVRKRYLALVDGELRLAPGEEALTIDQPIAPDGRRSGRMRVHPEGKPARTHVRPLRYFRGLTWVECRPETGRTHQIRVHLAWAGFPLAVDPLYGRRDGLLLSEFKRGYKPKPGREERPLLGRLALHAAGLELPCPEAHLPAELPPGLRLAFEGGRLSAELDPPADLTRTLERLARFAPARH